MKTLIQPFELLGVATNSTPKEVRKAYYHLALLCHPDKGGDPKDMRMLQTAYEWVMGQIESIDADYTYEQAQEEFDSFVQAQNAGTIIPSFSEVMLEAQGLSPSRIREWYEENTYHVSPDTKTKEHYYWFQQFLWREIHLSGLVETDTNNHAACLEKALQQLDLAASTNMMAASISHGYGAYVETPETPYQAFPSKEVVVYKEQKPFMFQTPLCADIHTPAQLDDYSTAVGSVGGYDYSLAFTDQSPGLDKDLEEVCANFADQVSIWERLERVEKEREMMDEDVATNKIQNTMDVMFGTMEDSYTSFPR
jgi:hypothetical protein